MGTGVQAMEGDPRSLVQPFAQHSIIYVLITCVYVLSMFNWDATVKTMLRRWRNASAILRDYK